MRFRLDSNFCIFEIHDRYQLNNWIYLFGNVRIKSSNYKRHCYSRHYYSRCGCALWDCIMAIGDL